jgi:starch synthase
MTAQKILFITTEMSPYLADTEMSVIARNLSLGIQERGKEIRAFMPRFGCVNERRNQLHEVIRLSGINMIIGGDDHPLIIKVASMPSAKMQVYFIDNEEFFYRKFLFHDENGEEFEDNDVRSLFYIRGVLETIKKLRWFPDLIHCHGWITALVPLFTKKYYKSDPCFKKSKVVYSLYGDDFIRPLRENFVKKVKLEGITYNDLKGIKERADFIALSKLAIDFSDGIIAGSPNVNPELIEYAQQKENGKFLPFQPEDTYIEIFNQFYDQLLSGR